MWCGLRRAKFVQIYASSFLLKEIKLEAGGLEGEGISISHLNSDFLCGIVTLDERRGIYGGFRHQRKIKSSKFWAAFFHNPMDSIHHIQLQIFEDSYIYILSQDTQTTCFRKKAMAVASPCQLWASSSQAATTSGKLSCAGPSPSPLSLWEVLDVSWSSRSPWLTGVPNAGRAGSSPLADQTPKITRGKSLTWGFRPGKEMREEEFKSGQPCWNIPGLLFPIEYWAMKAGSESTVPVEGEIIG